MGPALCGPMASFSRPVSRNLYGGTPWSPFDSFWMPFGLHLGPFGHPLGSISIVLATLSVHLGPFRIRLGSILAPFGLRPILLYIFVRSPVYPLVDHPIFRNNFVDHDRSFDFWSKHYPSTEAPSPKKWVGGTPEGITILVSIG